jgi:ATP-dependent protease ClpP protease subunit
LLIHQLSSWNGGNYSNLRVQFEEDTRLQNLIEDLIVKKTNIPLELLRQKIDGKDWYLSPEECLKYGIATEII